MVCQGLPSPPTEDIVECPLLALQSFLRLRTAKRPIASSASTPAVHAPNHSNSVDHCAASTGTSSTSGATLVSSQPTTEELSPRPGRGFQGKEITDCLTLSAMLLDAQKVALVPGDPFEAPGYCRLSYAISQEDIDAGLDAIEAFIAQLD